MKHNTQVHAPGGVSVFTGPGMYYRGDWTITASYGPQNCVTVKGGSNKGLYIAIALVDPNENAPGVSPKWLKIAGMDSQPVLS